MKYLKQYAGAAALVATLLAGAGPAPAQTCYTGSDLEPAVLASLQNAVHSYDQEAQTGNSAALQPNADFELGDLLAANQALLSGTASIRSVYVLDNTAAGGQVNATGAARRAEFFCGVYNSPDKVDLVFDGLPPGRYGIVVEDMAGKTPAMVSWILRQTGSQWKVAGLYVKPKQIAGHDGQWYIAQARGFRAKGQIHNAWLYYLVAEESIRPFPAISDPKLDTLYDEMQAVKPNDFPFGAPVELVSGGSTFKIAQVFATGVGDNLDVVVRYLEPDISDTARTFHSNMEMIKAVVAKYPELRDAFAGIVARAVAPNGQDYGSMLAMKDVK
jgi:hypothetical protein